MLNENPDSASADGREILHPDGVALHDRRPQNVGGGLLEGERQAGQCAPGPGHFGLRGGRREREIDRADECELGPGVRLPVEEAELASFGQTSILILIADAG